MESYSDSGSGWVKLSFGGHDVLMKKETLERYEPESIMLKCKETGLTSPYDRDDPLRSLTLQDLPVDPLRSLTLQDLPVEVNYSLLFCPTDWKRN